MLNTFFDILPYLVIGTAVIVAVIVAVYRGLRDRQLLTANDAVKVPKTDEAVVSQLTTLIGKTFVERATEGVFVLQEVYTDYVVIMGGPVRKEISIATFLNDFVMR